MIASFSNLELSMKATGANPPRSLKIKAVPQSAVAPELLPRIVVSSAPPKRWGAKFGASCGTSERMTAAAFDKLDTSGETPCKFRLLSRAQLQLSDLLTRSEGGHARLAFGVGWWDRQCIRAIMGVVIAVARAIELLAGINSTRGVSAMCRQIGLEFP